MELARYIGVVGSREFSNYKQLSDRLDQICERGDILVSGGARGADSLAQRYAKERGLAILIFYPDYKFKGRGAAFARNRSIAESSHQLIAFYQRGRMGEGGTANTIEWARKLNIPFIEVEEE